MITCVGPHDLEMMKAKQADSPQSKLRAMIEAERTAPSAPSRKKK